MRRIVSFTTIFSRLTMIQPTLECIFNQTLRPDEVVLWLPESFERESQEDIHSLPTFLDDYELNIVRCTDLGPFTKLGHNLGRERPDTMIVTADDDVHYPPTWFEGLVTASERWPDHAIGYRGKKFSSSGSLSYNDMDYFFGADPPAEVDLITGTWGALYKPRFFDERIHNHVEFPRAFFNDDIWICGHLARLGVPRLIIPNPGIEPNLDIAHIDALWASNKTGVNNDAIIDYMKDYFFGRP